MSPRSRVHCFDFLVVDVGSSMGAAQGRYIGQTLNEQNPIRRDTFLIPAYSWMIIRFVTDNRACLFPAALPPAFPHHLASGYFDEMIGWERGR